MLSMILELPTDAQQRLLSMATSGDYKTPSCPSCGEKMVVRTTKKGTQTGKQFWGCSHYPRCRQTMKIAQQVSR
ncbi:topoisomerase DNA-binding C4 zinc finger domain-containing protein [Solemya pervernicosa gill symbiont]|uniref:topoisomerase DNA-binding C4 zinc finger domain-containing protein n=1 Tax=Solemya pervernicosa gill symbiont TaxID=642797 RepID=UPI0038B59A59